MVSFNDFCHVDTVKEIRTVMTAASEVLIITLFHIFMWLLELTLISEP